MILYKKKVRGGRTVRKRKICCFCERWASGGIESFLYHSLSQMDMTELEVDIVAAKLEENRLSLRLEAMGVRFVQLSGSLRNVPENHRRFRQLLRQRQYDVVHLNLYQGLALYYCRIARQEGVPVRIAHSHNENLRKSHTRWLKLPLHRLGRRCFTKDATALWACSGAAASFLFGWQKDFTFIPNGIDTERFRFNAAVRQTLRRELGVEHCLVLGHVGRLCQQKNQHFLLEVLAKLLPMHPGSRLLLVGEGEDRDMLGRRAAELGIENQVIFYGSSQQVERLLWVMDVFALPSLFEGLAVAAVEAQASGLPVLCAQGLSKEVKLTGNLRFLPLEDGATAWAAEIMFMASQARNRDADAAAVREAGFESSDVSRRIKESYMGRNDGTA
jgi:glycosyltransferase involved in cell wall biosynthesis